MKKPFWIKKLKCWYVADENNRQVRLDPDETKAFEKWRKLIDLSNYKHSETSIEALCEGWLDENEHKLDPDRYAKHVYLLQSFAEFVGLNTKARDLSAADVERWLHTKRTWHGKTIRWGVARRRDGGQAVQKVYKMACMRGWLPMNDILSMRFETPDPRDTLIDRSVHQRMIDECRNRKTSRCFACFLIALWHSGARPISIRHVTARHVDGNGDWVFSKHKTQKKSKRKLVVRTSPCLATLTRILAHSRPTGPLFLNARGEPWTKDGVARRIARMRKRLKIEEEFTAYSYHHTYATDALLNGIDVSTVAELMGHSSPEKLH